MTFFELTVNWVLLIEHIQLLVFCGNYFIFYWQDISMIWLGFVIKSKVALCTTRRQGVESRKITLFRKPGGWEDVRLSSVQFSHSVMPDSVWPRELHHPRPPCWSPIPRVHPNPCELSWWYHPTISPCHPLLLPTIFPSIKVFGNESVPHIRCPKYWSFSFKISPSNEHSGLISFRIEWFDSLQSKGLSRVFFNTTVQKHQFFSTQLFL